jgi:uncharacterized protein
MHSETGEAEGVGHDGGRPPDTTRPDLAWLGPAMHDPVHVVSISIPPPRSKSKRRECSRVCVDRAAGSGRQPSTRQPSTRPPASRPHFCASSDALLYAAAVFTAGNLLLGALAAVIVGLSKTALPGAALVATPIFALIVTGRAIPGTTLPVLLAADLFAVSWYRRHTRWDMLRPLMASTAVGFAAGVAFFAVVGSATRPIEVVIGVIILSMSAIQTWRMIRRQHAKAPTAFAAAVYGTGGGFTTFVANAAGPVMNTYLVRLGLRKVEMVGTSAWFYFAVNVAKVPVYLALGKWSHGGRFFTAEGLAFDAAVLPAMIVGVYGGKAMLHKLPERAFLIGVLVLSAAGAIKLLLP